MHMKRLGNVVFCTHFIFGLFQAHQPSTHRQNERCCVYLIETTLKQYTSHKHKHKHNHTAHSSDLPSSRILCMALTLCESMNK